MDEFIGTDKKVWLVTREYPYEGTDVHDIFDLKSDAIAYVENRISKIKDEIYIKVDTKTKIVWRSQSGEVYLCQYIAEEFIVKTLN